MKLLWGRDVRPGRTIRGPRKQSVWLPGMSGASRCWCACCCLGIYVCLGERNTYHTTFVLPLRMSFEIGGASSRCSSVCSYPSVSLSHHITIISTFLGTLVTQYTHHIALSSSHHTHKTLLSLKVFATSFTSLVSYLTSDGEAESVGESHCSLVDQ